MTSYRVRRRTQYSVMWLLSLVAYLLNATIAAQRRPLEALKATGQPSPGDTLPFGELTAFVGFDEYNAEAERYSTGE